MPHSHNRVVRGATGKRCAISLIRRGFRACEEGRAELRGGGAAMQDGTNAGAVHDAAGGDLRNVELPHENLVSTTVPRQLSGTSGLNTPRGRQLHSLALRHYRMDASIGNGLCLIGIRGRGKQDCLHRAAPEPAPAPSNRANAGRSRSIHALSTLASNRSKFAGAG